MSWIERKNKKILQKVRPNISLEAMTNLLKIKIFGTRDEEKDIIVGITAEKRKKGKPCLRWMDDIKRETGLSVNDLNQLAKDRKKWHVLVNNIVKKRKRTNV